MGVLRVPYHDVGLISVEVNDIFISPGVVGRIFNAHNPVGVDAVLLECDVRPIVHLAEVLEVLAIEGGFQD